MMKRIAIIASFLSMAVAASGSVRGGAGLETTEQTRAESDSLTLKNEELPPMLPGMFPFRNGYTPPDLSRLQPLEIPVFSRFDLSGSSALSPVAYAPYEFVMPDRDLFMVYTRFRQQEGITIPVGSVNSPRMIFSGGGYMPLVASDNHSMGLTGLRQRLPSMGYFNSISAGYSWVATDRITLYGNLRISDNMFHLTRFKDISVSGRARIRVTDGIWLNARGNYSIYNNSGMQPLPLGMYPTNSFGGTIEVKITDKIGIEGGVMREYNPFQRRWETNPYIMPVFY